MPYRKRQVPTPQLRSDTLHRVAANDPAQRIVDWRPRVGCHHHPEHCTNADVLLLSTALVGNTNVQGIYLSHNSALTDVGVAPLCDAIRGTGVCVVRLENTAVSAPIQAQLRARWRENACRRVAADDPALRTLLWYTRSLVSVEDLMQLAAVLPGNRSLKNLYFQQNQRIDRATWSAHRSHRRRALRRSSALTQ